MSAWSPFFGAGVSSFGGTGIRGFIRFALGVVLLDWSREVEPFPASAPGVLPDLELGTADLDFETWTGTGILTRPLGPIPAFDKGALQLGTNFSGGFSTSCPGAPPVALAFSGEFWFGDLLRDAFGYNRRRGRS